MSWEIRQGDALALLREMPEASVDAVVTDPPYGLEFMGVKWDTFGDGKGNEWGDFGSREHPRTAQDSARVRRNKAVAFERFSWTWSAEALRVAKPGAHLLAFGGSRTYHRLACAIEDAGWEVRDCLMWLYGSGFPKSLDVSKAIDKAAGAEREVVGRYQPPGMEKPWNLSKATDERGVDVFASSRNNLNVTAPATDEAAEWQGWGTTLKPAHEPIVLARKPLAGTVAANVLEHGTGALNIDGCRVPTSDTISVSSGIPSSSEAWNRPWHSDPEARERRRQLAEESRARAEKLGRWPANVLLDSEAAEALDEQSGERASGFMAAGTQREGIGYHGRLGCAVRNSTHGDRGGASRFFYTAKASAGERHAQGRNAHPTVKPVDLMRWLCRLVTPRGGLVLDPFTGSGSTGVAALAEGFRFLGFEREADYCRTARERIGGRLFAEIQA